jgi:ketosteroid isomerase-like protein
MGDPRAVAERWTRALSEHDVEAAVACFDPDYEDEAPARPGESVKGQENVRRNFETLFQDVPNLRAEILSAVVDGDSVWMEWRMHGTRSNGTPFEFAGVNIFGVREDRFAWGRIYTELVRDAGGVDGQLQRMTKGD